MSTVRAGIQRFPRVRKSMISRVGQIAVLRAQSVGTDAEFVRPANLGRADADSRDL